LPPPPNSSMPSPLSSYNVPNTPSGHNRPTVLQEGLMIGHFFGCGVRSITFFERVNFILPSSLPERRSRQALKKKPQPYVSSAGVPGTSHRASVTKGPGQHVHVVTRRVLPHPKRPGGVPSLPGSLESLPISLGGSCLSDVARRPRRTHCGCATDSRRQLPHH
jgi:hypothetical protein